VDYFNKIYVDYFIVKNCGIISYKYLK